MTTPAILEEAGHAMLGPLDVIGFHDGHRGTALMRAHSQIHGEVIIKVHRSAQHHQQETHAYCTWIPALGDRAPSLIAINTDPAAIAVTAVPGQPLAQLCLPAEEEREAFQQAGSLLRTLHAAGPPKHDPHFKMFLADRGRYWLARTGTMFSSRNRSALEDLLEQLTRLPVDTLTPCHLDFMPRNLLYDPDGIIRVIDFEHARYDLPARDLVRLATRIWPKRPDLEDAFLSGYGSLTDLDRAVIACCTAIDLASHAYGQAAPL